MDYEKKYKEALEMARDYYKANLKLDKVDENLILEDIFPELKESEDERIRKCIGDVVREYDWSHIFGVTKDDCLSWLEKQGETYTKKDIDNAYLEGMAFAKDELEKQNKQILANSAKTCKDEQEPTDNDIKEALRTEYEKGRADAIAEIQNPAWSKEDESYLNTTIAYLKDAKEFKKTADNCINWLKSLRSQPKKEWSEEDEEFLRRAINATKDAYPITAKWLKSLKSRVQPKQEWSKEDESIALGIEQIVNCASLLNIAPDRLNKVRDWLKSLKQRIGG